MRIRFCRCLLPVLTLALSFDAQPAAARPIEAVKGKQYKLTKRHGPWMIMVASFHELPPEVRTEGLSPQEAADQLVYELRRKGIPAYTFAQDDVVDELDTFDRLGRRTTRRYRAQQGAISVLAGNYPSIGSTVAQKTLDYVKRFHPRFLRGEANSRGVLTKLENGGVYAKTPGQPTPLAGAFLAINPMLSPEEVQSKKRDPLILKLNSGQEFSLLSNPGNYTVVVASFYGKTKTAVGDANFLEAASNFEVGDKLDEAANSAWELTKALRNARSLGYDRDYEAYVYHDRFRSIVTIGAFDRPDDPRIEQVNKFFGAKLRTNEVTKRDAFVAEFFTIPRDTRNRPPEKSWLFDPYPQVMAVPKLY